MMTRSSKELERTALHSVMTVAFFVARTLVTHAALAARYLSLGAPPVLGFMNERRAPHRLCKRSLIYA